MSINEICWFITLCVALMAPVLDFKFKKVPTWLTVPTLFAGLGIAAAQGWQPISLLSVGDSINLGQTFISIVAVVVVFGPLTWKGAFSKEDLLLLMAVVSLNTCLSSMSIIFFTAAAGFLMALFYLIYKGLLLEGLKASLRALTFQGKKRTEDGKVAGIHKLSIPYSPAVCVGVIYWFCDMKEFF